MGDTEAINPGSNHLEVETAILENQPSYEDLHSSINGLELQVASLENERNYLAVLSAVNGQEKDNLQQSLLEKSQHIADLSMENYKLKEHISASMEESEKYIRQREKENKKLLRQSEMENKMLREVVLSIQTERITSEANSSDLTDIVSDEDDISVESTMTPDSQIALDGAAKKVKVYVAKLKKQREDLKDKCRLRKEKMLRLEAKNQELQAKLKKLEGLHGSVENEPVAEENPGLDSLQPQPLSDDMDGNNMATETQEESDGEYEDEYYGTMYHYHRDVEEKLPEEPEVLRSRERGLSDASLSSLEADEESVATVLSSNTRRGSNSSRYNRRPSDASHASYASQSRAIRRQSVESLSSRSLTNSVLREFDSPGKVKQRPAGSMANPWKKSPRLQRNVGISRKNSTRKGAMSPPPPPPDSRSLSPNLSDNSSRKIPPSPTLSDNSSRKLSISSTQTSNSRKKLSSSTTPRSLSPTQKRRSFFSFKRSSKANIRETMTKSSSQPELTSLPRRAVAQEKLQQRRSILGFGLGSTASTARNPRSGKNKHGYNIKVDGVRGTYTGPMREDIPHGVGSIAFANGDMYIGGVVNGKLHGAGTLYYAKKKKGVDRGVWRNNELWS